ASDYTDALGEKSVQLTLRFLTSCYDDGRNLANREKMHNASTMAGMAFNCANLGLNHSIAHQLGAQFHVP
ncbi:iron-containing alcohol dehydrogenase, partial [Escherichia coli]|nr:iron-containing alcohol dehydrogenase [Escherichia coli]